jgi:hypothetical protein
VRERLAHQAEARGVRQRAVTRKLREHPVVVRGIDDDAHVLPVLRAARTIAGPPMSMFSIASSSVQSARATVARKGIQVHDDQVDRRYAVRVERRTVRGVVASREDPRVNPGMERLDAAVEHLGKPGVARHVGHREPRFGQRLRRAAGRQQRVAARGERAREIDDAALVGDRQQRLPRMRVHP